jgi:hypothetical protein
MQDKQRSKNGLANHDSLIAGTAQVRLQFRQVGPLRADGSQPSQKN